MDNGKCCAKGCYGFGGLCPVSFGLAVGFTCALAIIIWSGWVMYFGVPQMMAGMQMHMMMSGSWVDIIKHALFALLKGFLFGFFMALIYDLMLCCGKKFCCRSKDKGK